MQSTKVGQPQIEHIGFELNLVRVANRGLERSGGRVQPILLAENRAMDKMRSSIVWLDAKCLVDVYEGFLQALLGTYVFQGCSQADMSLARCWHIGDCTAEKRDG